MRTDVVNAKLWWPHGYGDPNLYDITFNVFDEEGNLVCDYHTKYGLRKCKLIRTDVGVGAEGEFRVEVNNVPIMCKPNFDWLAARPAGLNIIASNAS
jgi:beta-mannosidase